MPDTITAKMDTKQVEMLLRMLSKGALDKASARTLNRIAKRVDNAQRENVQKDFINRNNYTANSLRMYSASESRPMDKQDAVVGSVSPYLPVQESGGTVRAQKQKIPIPTLASRGGNYRVPVLSRYRLAKLAGKTFVLSPAKNGKGTLKRAGLYIRIGKKRSDILRIRDVEQSEIQIKARHWHTDAVKKWATELLYNSIFKQEAEKVVKEIQGK